MKRFVESNVDNSLGLEILIIDDWICLRIKSKKASTCLKKKGEHIQEKWRTNWREIIWVTSLLDIPFLSSFHVDTILMLDIYWHDICLQFRYQHHNRLCQWQRDRLAKQSNNNSSISNQTFHFFFFFFFKFYLYRKFFGNLIGKFIKNWIKHLTESTPISIKIDKNNFIGR